jgi:hypothetical protein
MAEYALGDRSQPAGVAEYKLLESLLPSCKPICPALSRLRMNWVVSIYEQGHQQKPQPFLAGVFLT